MQRQTFVINLTIQMENPLQSIQFGAPILVTNAAIVTNAEGQPMSQATQWAQPAIPDDITDEILAALQAKFATIGLEVSRKVA